MKKLRLILSFATIALFFYACSPEKEYADTAYPSSAQRSQGNINMITAISAGFPETFESGTKTAYAAGNVVLSSGTWNLNEALIGTSSSDPKNGTKSVRIRDLGKLSMQFNVTTGASSVSIKHAKYGTDASSTWELWMSVNSGSSYTKVGSTVTTSTTTLQTANFTMSVTGNVRFEIRKISGGTNRINIDDFTIVDLADGGGGSGTSFSQSGKF